MVIQDAEELPCSYLQTLNPKHYLQEKEAIPSCMGTSERELPTHTVVILGMERRPP